MQENTLNTLLNDIRSCRIVACGQKHEQVIGVRTSIWNEERQEFSKTYDRVGLCSSKVRNALVGCAHTPANNKFLELLKRAEERDASISDLRVEFDQVIMRIYLMDHQRGALEKELFYAPKDKHGTIQTDIASLFNEHGQLMNRLTEIKMEVICKLL